MKLAQEAERGLFDACFLAEGLAVAFGGGTEGGNAKVAGFEPVTLLRNRPDQGADRWHVGSDGIDLDGPLPAVELTEGMKSNQALIRQIADENGFTIRQLYQHVASARGHFTIVGKPAQIGDVLEDWFHNEGADGFNILPTGLTDFVDLVIPELQRRNLFRTEYEGRTLRVNLGLPFPETRWALSRRAATISSHTAE